MKILTGYVIRAHIGPFLFAFTAVTGLLFLNAVAQRLEDLAGKGLGMEVIGEFLLLSFPHIVALTFPMAILVAVLYAFSELTTSNELAAMAGGGIHPVRLMLPLAGVGLLLSAAMFYFNDRTLPESNHRLSSLLSDIGSKSPTFELREEIVNEVRTGDNSRYFLRARTIDPVTNELEDVTIFDLSRMGESRTIQARHGIMAFSPDLRDLYLTLEDGVIYETSDERPGSFQRLSFTTQILPLRGVGGELERREGGSRSDREMPIAMLEERVQESLGQLQRIAAESHRLSTEIVRETLSFRTPEEWAELIGADAADPSFAPEVVAAEDLLSLSDALVQGATGILGLDATRWDIFRLSAYRYRVEIHKKYAIAFACLIFILLGPPLAIRYPQGGVGMVIAASVGIFFFYWLGLIGGERLADRGQIDPMLGMWIPNLVLLLPALLLMAQSGKRISTNRGGRWDEFVFRVRALLGRAG
jgi:lipopolysaccharide export system permease protein